MESCAQKKKYLAKDYKSDLKPIWCPGCGDYTVLNGITRALAENAVIVVQATPFYGDRDRDTTLN